MAKSFFFRAKTEFTVSYLTPHFQQHGPLVRFSEISTSGPPILSNISASSTGPRRMVRARARTYFHPLPSFEKGMVYVLQ